MTQTRLVATVALGIGAVIIAYFVVALALNVLVAFWPLGIALVAALAFGTMLFVRALRRGRRERP